ncbi:MAG: hypothetical protein JO353_13265 [Phycisphaerae bacterium]|nr:hypothetical protein [Phycisphaerae bacterium]
MRWFVDSSLTPAVADALIRHEHKAVPLPERSWKEIRGAQLDVITADGDWVAEALRGETGFNRSIIYLLVGPGEVEQDDAVDRLFTRFKRLVPGRLYTVTNSRVKVRQLRAKSHAASTK